MTLTNVSSETIVAVEVTHNNANVQLTSNLYNVELCNVSVCQFWIIFITLENQKLSHANHFVLLQINNHVSILSYNFYWPDGLSIRPANYVKTLKARYTYSKLITRHKQQLKAALLKCTHKH